MLRSVIEHQWNDRDHILFVLKTTGPQMRKKRINVFFDEIEVSKH